MSERDTSNFDQNKIYTRSDGWEEEWSRVITHLFDTPGIMAESVKALSGLRSFSTEKEAFISELYLFYRIEPDKVLKSFDPAEGNLLDWLTSYTTLLMYWRRYVRKNLSSGISWDDSNPEILDYQLSRNVISESKITEEKIIGDLIVQLDKYSLCNSGTRLTEQAALQNFLHLKSSRGQGIQRILQELYNAVSAINPGAKPDELILQRHAQAQEHHQRLHEEYSAKTALSRKDTKFFQKFERKIIKNQYLRLFCPIRSVEAFKELLNFSSFNAYKRPSEYRKKLLPVLLPHYREELEYWEQMEE